jgi:UDP-N-acetylmuramate--alanine ligase
MTLKNKKLSSKTELIHNIKQSNAVIKVVIGAGDIGEMVVDITKELSYES